ncbi:DUF72 domain-containing protein [Umezawaea beigongshangensis]|uniref:DUF72 domain-containing protein n=1 Tax=Umezawaea beigongshangensis TaxID=2780383 RepID=UPI003F683C37
MGEIRIGTSGWVYPEWRGGFYPAGLPQRLELEHLAERVSSVELNGSFYSLRSPANYRSWARRTPPGFVLAVKGHREVTHARRLRGADAAVTAFFESGVLELGAKLGPVLWQLPPSLPFDAARLDDFLALLPPRPVRHAVEARHPSFADPAFPALLREHGVANVISDSAGTFPCFDDVTTDFAYVRLHGHEELYASAYSAAQLDGWAVRARDLAEDGDVFVYFDNTMRGAAPVNAMALAERLSR